MNVQDILKYGNITVLNSLDGLDEKYWEQGGVCGVWSVKEILAHLISFEHILKDVLGSILGEDEVLTLDPYRDQGDEDFNDVEVGKRKDMSVSDIVEEYTAAQAIVAELAAKIPADKYRENGTIPWYGEEYCLDDFIVYTNYAHKREHVAQINVFKDTL